MLKLCTGLIPLRAKPVLGASLAQYRGPKKHQFVQLSWPSHMGLSCNLELKLNFKKRKIIFLLIFYRHGLWAIGLIPTAGTLDRSNFVCKSDPCSIGILNSKWLKFFPSALFWPLGRHLFGGNGPHSVAPVWKQFNFFHKNDPNWDWISNNFGQKNLTSAHFGPFGRRL